MSRNWNKGLTKETNSSVFKISQTMRKRNIDNFKQWRKEARKDGILSSYQPLVKNGDLAELIGVVLGDGSIYKYPRTQGLRITANAKNKGFINHYSYLVEGVFNKKPSLYNRQKEKAVDIRLYQNKLSERLGVPIGARRDLIIEVPVWVLKKEEFIVRYLRGLYEAEGYFSEHLPTYTHKFCFVNQNQSMLANVEGLLKRLKFHPHRTKVQIQLSRKEEVYRAIRLFHFRDYNCGII